MLSNAIEAVQAVDPSALRAFTYLLGATACAFLAFGLAAGWALKRR